eukprot:1156535-Pelagomonas_calceolata.AAC.11
MEWGTARSPSDPAAAVTKPNLPKKGVSTASGQCPVEKGKAILFTARFWSWALQVTLSRELGASSIPNAYKDKALSQEK